MCGTLHVIPTVAKGGEKYLKIQWNSKRFLLGPTESLPGSLWINGFLVKDKYLYSGQIPSAIWYQVYSCPRFQFLGMGKGRQISRNTHANRNERRVLECVVFGVHLRTPYTACDSSFYWIVHIRHTMARNLFLAHNGHIIEGWCLTLSFSSHHLSFAIELLVPGHLHIAWFLPHPLPTNETSNMFLRKSEPTR